MTQSHWTGYLGRLVGLAVGFVFIFWGHPIVRYAWRVRAAHQLHYLANLPDSESLLAVILGHLYFVAYMLLGGGLMAGGGSLIASAVSPKRLLEHMYWSCLPGMIVILLAAAVAALLLIGRLIAWIIL